MGYVIHIQRKNENNKIKLTEWKNYINSDNEFISIEDYSAEINNGNLLTVQTPNAGLWKTEKGEVPFTFSEKHGWICVKNPENWIIEKMIFISKKLDGIVMGEEDEIYDEDYLKRETSNNKLSKNNYSFIKIASILAFAISVAGLIFLVENKYIISENIIAITIQILSIMLMIWARITFGFKSFHAPANAYKEKLVTNGPYKWLRHPIYAAVIYFSLGSIIAYPNIKTIIAVVIIIASTIVRMLLEEKSLFENFKDYDAYSKRTKRFIPFVY